LETLNRVFSISQKNGTFLVLPLNASIDCVILLTYIETQRHTASNILSSRCHRRRWLESWHLNKNNKTVSYREQIARQPVYEHTRSRVTNVLGSTKPHRLESGVVECVKSHLSPSSVTIHNLVDLCNTC